MNKTVLWSSLVVIIVGIIIILGLRQNTSTSTENDPVINQEAGVSTPLNDSPTTTESSLPKADSASTKKIMNIVTLKTNMGDIVIKLDTEHTPKTAENFITLATKGFYNETRFHRIIPNFMIQGGDPQSSDISKKDLWGTGGPGYQFADEIGSTNSNARGTISMANSGPNTNGSQFFINTVDNSFLNPKHTAFGTVTKGMDIVDMISKSETDTRDRPVKDVIIEKVIVE